MKQSGLQLLLFQVSHSSFFLQMSLKKVQKISKILYLIGAIICAIIVMEGILKIVTPKVDSVFMKGMIKVLMRIVQWGFGVIGLLITIGITKIKNKPKAV